TGPSPATNCNPFLAEYVTYYSSSLGNITPFSGKSVMYNSIIVYDNAQKINGFTVYEYGNHVDENSFVLFSSRKNAFRYNINPQQQGVLLKKAIFKNDNGNYKMISSTKNNYIVDV